MRQSYKKDNRGSYIFVQAEVESLTISKAKIDDYISMKKNIVKDGKDVDIYR